MVRKARARGGALQAIPENAQTVSATTDAKAGVDVRQIIESIEGQMEDRIATIMSAAEDAIVNLKNDLKTRLVRLTKATRNMPLKEFQEKYPDDFKTGALEEIRQRYAAMSEAAQHAHPATASKVGKTSKKRAGEPITVLQTVKTRRTGAALMPSWEAVPPAPIAAPRGESKNAAEDTMEEAAAPSTANHPIIENQQPAALVPSRNAFNGLPLQTPMPFAGAAMPLPITMLTQKRGGRTKAAPAPDAAVVTTADGMQWALGKEGVAGIPESHRAEVAEMLSAQFNFLAAALGKTVFDRPAGRGSRRG